MKGLALRKGSCACKRVRQVYFEKPLAPHIQDGKEKCATFIIICAVQILVNWDWPAITRLVKLLACQTERCLKYAVWVNLANYAAHCCGTSCNECDHSFFSKTQQQWVTYVWPISHWLIPYSSHLSDLNSMLTLKEKHNSFFIHSSNLTWNDFFSCH